jgi:signal transduction histidine kinase
LAKEGESVLKRRSIRTKLFVALTLLSAIVLLLASSGFWGLNRYQRLAQAVSDWAFEFDKAHELNQTALELKSIKQRIHQYNDGAMLNSATLEDPLIDITELESEMYNCELDSFCAQLKRYEDHIEAMIRDESAVIDTSKQQASLQRIASVLENLQEGIREIPQDLQSFQGTINQRHSALAKETTRHLDETRNGMDAFSAEVRGQCNAWIFVTYTCTICAFLMMGLLIAAFHSLVVKPFRTLVDGSRLVAGGQFDHRIDLGTGDELSELADAMNEMTDRFQGALAKVESWCTDLDRQVRERTREVIQNEQLASVGFLAAGVAHEINNPLASIAWSAESLQSRAAELAMLDAENRILDDELCESMFTNLRRIEEEAYRCKGITEKLLDFSRLSEVRRAPTDLSELVSDVVLMVSKVGKYRCKTIHVHAAQPVIVSINPQEIRQVVLNLVTNALESVDCDGAVEVNVDESDGRATVVVRDNGCGMSHEVLQHLFEPFFTRRRDGSGTGLGLSITYRIVSQHGGSLLAHSEGEGKGSTMEMHLPLSNGSKDSLASSANGWKDEPYQTA